MENTQGAAEGGGHIFTAPREWTRVHPISPLLGGWAVIAAVGTFWIERNLGGDDDEFLDLIFGRIAVLVGLAVGIAVIVIAAGYVSWWFHSFRLTDEAIEQRKGLLFKQFKQARLDRVQAVDVVQPLVGRLVGLAKLKIEVAGGTGSGIDLQYLRLAEAEAFRNELLARAGGAKLDRGAGADSGEGATDNPAAQQSHAPGIGGLQLAPSPGTARTWVAAAVERLLVAVPIKRTILSVLLSAGTIILAFIVVAGVTASIVASVLAAELDLIGIVFGGGAVGGAIAIFGWLAAALGQLNRGLNFKLGIAADGVRIAHGLLETTKQTIPPGRVQAVQFTQGLLWRKPDWWRVVINVAGYHEDPTKVSTLLPVGTRLEALTAMWSVLPDLGDPDPESMFSASLSGTGEDNGFINSPRSARWLDPWQWRRLGYKATDSALLIRSGWLGRVLIVVPHQRTQSLEISQGPLQRRLGLATVTVHSTPGPVKPVVRHLALADATALLEEQAARAAVWRRRQTTEQWLVAVGFDGESGDDVSK